MNVGWQMFIFVTIIYQTCASISRTRPTLNRGFSDNGLGKCDCDVLQINDALGVIGDQNFIKQNGTYNEKPYYFSNQWNMISWNTHYWSYGTYDPKSKLIESKENDSTNLFSSENMCKDVAVEVFWHGRIVKSRCLKDNVLRNRNCSANKELTRINNEIQVKLQPENPCKFPFVYKNETYKSCTKKDRDKFWCAATVDATNVTTSWGYCNDLCPMEEDNTHHLEG